MKRETPKIIFISWAPHCSRSEYIAQELGAKSYMVYYDFLGSNYYTIIFKYFFQTIRTLFILFRDRPNVVLVMSPSFAASVPVYLYCKLFGSVFLIDAHTGALNNPMWKRVLFLQRHFCRKALLTIVTNKKLAMTLVNWKANYMIIPDVPIKPKNIRIPKLSADINITFVNTFAGDEPTLVFLEATKKLEHIHFYVTGKINRKVRHLTSLRLNNVVFTDFLDNADYYGLLMASDLIVVLTTQDHTMQRGAYEAIYCGKPVLTSDWEILRKNFPIGAVFVDNSANGIVDGINEMLQKIQTLHQEAQSLRERKENIWNDLKKELLEAIHKC